MTRMLDILQDYMEYRGEQGIPRLCNTLIITDLNVCFSEFKNLTINLAILTAHF